MSNWQTWYLPNAFPSIRNTLVQQMRAEHYLLESMLSLFHRPPSSLYSSFILIVLSASSSATCLSSSVLCVSSDFWFASAPMTVSNVDQSASTDPNSLPTAITPSSERLSLLIA